MARVTTNFRVIDIVDSFPSFVVSTTALSKAIHNQDITLSVISGNLWIRTDGVAAALTDLKFTVGQVVDLHVYATLSMLSDATTATVQIIAWDE